MIERVSVLELELHSLPETWYFHYITFSTSDVVINYGYKCVCVWGGGGGGGICTYCCHNLSSLLM